MTLDLILERIVKIEGKLDLIDWRLASVHHATETAHGRLDGLQVILDRTVEIQREYGQRLKRLAPLEQQDMEAQARQKIIKTAIRIASALATAMLLIGGRINLAQMMDTIKGLFGV